MRALAICARHKPDRDLRLRHLPASSHPSPPPCSADRLLLACQLRDWLHVIANSKTSYELRYYNIHDQDADEDED